MPAAGWFTAVDFRNAISPRHPDPIGTLGDNNEMKRRLVMPWIAEGVRGKRVLDLFCANGTFSVEAGLAGAREVVGVDYSPERIECARFLASTVEDKIDCAFTFVSGDIYELPRLVTGPFDVVLAFGGLYHVADPAFVLRKIRALTRERLIVQTSNIINLPGTWGRFEVRRTDGSAHGRTSIRPGHGAWRLSVGCFEALLRHARFHVVESTRPPWLARRRYPWYCAVAEPF